ncbi:hypothetical protein NW757_014753 [Fusarium falciforme]|nr:hypothetical protein NW757_014753 [Fusarium falciforme]
MRTASLDDDELDFLALSYHWGNPTPMHDLDINGRILKVTENLHLFLATVTSVVRKDELKLCQKGQPMVFWVDGICINQQNIPEKNAQVPLMSEIYLKARAVVAHVGDCPRTSTPMAGLVALAAFASVDARNPMTGLPLTETPDNAPAALRDIANRPWYMRSWVTQEMVLARSALCLYGNATMAISIDLSILAALVNRVQEQRHHNPRYAQFFDDESNDRQMEGLRQIDTWRRLQENRRENQLTAVQVMYRTRPTAATDPRDKVYSVLALLPESYRAALRPDYSEANSAQDVFKAMARHMVRSGDGMSMLYYAGTRKNLPGMPSWVPDWSFEPYHRIDEGNYKTTGMLSVLPADISLSDDGDAISLSAILWDIVDFVHVAVSHPPDPNDTLSSIAPFDFLTIMENATHALCERLKSQHGRYPCNAASVEDVVWRTLVADAAWAEEGRAGDAERGAYDAFLSTQPRGDAATHIRLLADSGACVYETRGHRGVAK